MLLEVGLTNSKTSLYLGNRRSFEQIWKRRNAFYSKCGCEFTTWVSFNTERLRSIFHRSARTWHW